MALEFPDGSVLIEAHGLGLSLGGRAILDDVSLAVHAGEIVTIIGLNGAGKSSLVRLLIGLLVPDRGHVRRADGVRIGYMPQHLVVDPTLPLTVTRFLTLGAKASSARLEAVLGEVGAGSVMSSQLADISGGELHRVMLARALLRDPDLLVLDEPMSGVDVSGQAELYRLIGALRDRRGCGVLLVSHDLHLVMAATDRVVCLNQHICCSGTPRAVTRDPAFAEMFGRHVADTLAVYEHHHDHAHDVHGDVVDLSPAGTGR